MPRHSLSWNRMALVLVGAFRIFPGGLGADGSHPFGSSPSPDRRIHLDGDLGEVFKDWLGGSWKRNRIGWIGGHSERNSKLFVQGVGRYILQMTYRTGPFMILFFGSCTRDVGARYEYAWAFVALGISPSWTPDVLWFHVSPFHLMFTDGSPNSLIHSSRPKASGFTSPVVTWWPHGG